MKFEKLNIDGPIICKPKIIKDSRGFFCENYRKDLLEEYTNRKLNFCQSNSSVSKSGVLRGLHFQTHPYSQTKLISVCYGEILDVIVDIRENSNTFGNGIKVILNDSNNYQLLVPKGFAHGFLVLSKTAKVSYQVDNHYKKEYDFGINSLDPKLNLGLESYVKKIHRSERDKSFPNLAEIPKYKF